MLRILIFLLLAACHSYGQTKYFILQDSSSKYNSYNYTLNTKKLYGIEDSISIYNLIFYDEVIDARGNVKRISGDDSNIILFSVLPNLDGSTWEETDLESIKNYTIGFKELKRLYNEHSFIYYNKKYGEITKFWNDYKIVVKKDGKYYVPKNALLEFYAVRNRPEMFNNLIGTINTGQPCYTIDKMIEVFEEMFKGDEFPLFTLRGTTSHRFDRIRDRKEFMSKKYEIEGNMAYQFWTYTDWKEDGRLYEYQRGIDRFVYIPNKGIVGGTYDFYFFMHRKRLNLTVASFIENMRAEKVMIAN